MKPKILSSQIIHKVNDYHTQIVNVSRLASVLIAGQDMYILEVAPAGYIILAANEAEKSANITLVDCRTFGAVGRLYLGGKESDVARRRQGCRVGNPGHTRQGRTRSHGGCSPRAVRFSVRKRCRWWTTLKRDNPPVNYTGEDEVTIHPIANELLTAFEASLLLARAQAPKARLFFAGVDLGTAYIVTAVVDSMGVPVAGVVTRSESSIRDGLVLDYMGAIRLLREQVQVCGPPDFHQESCRSLSSGHRWQKRPGGGERAVRRRSGGAGLIDEPSAAAKVLRITDGAVVDIGGGTTGISVIHDGEPIYTADEATGARTSIWCWRATSK